MEPILPFSVVSCPVFAASGNSWRLSRCALLPDMIGIGIDH
jgi:hypothetical protein